MPRAKGKKFKLTPELVPSDLWGRSASKMLKGRVAWTKRIRPDAIEKAGRCCEICESADGTLICHDKWDYDDRTLTATLIAFEIHCKACDLVCHFKRMMQVAEPDAVLLSAVHQLCKVNGCQEQEAISILHDADRVWTQRNQERWTVAVAAPLLKKYPELEFLPAFVPVSRF